LNRNANIQADNQLRFRGVRTDGNRWLDAKLWI
jgi:hypothetical protein